MNILLLYPEFPDTFWSYKHALSFVGKKATVPPLGLLTVAAMLPVQWDRRLLDAVGGLDPLGAAPLRGALRLTSVLLRNPGLLASTAVYSLIRGWRERRLLGSIAVRLLTLRGLRVRPWVLVVHAFMSKEELSTTAGRERLDACVFRVPVDGRMVSMCELNGTDLRLRLNRAQGA